MNTLSHAIDLGHMELVETYEYFDRPVLFTCRDRIGTLFLVVWVDETDDADIWLYASMSSTRFNMVRSGGIELRDAFRLAEQATVYKVTTPYEDIDSTVESISVGDIPEEYLPYPGEYLNLPTATLPSLGTSLTVLATQSNREYLRFKLNAAGNRSEAPIDTLGRIFVAIQETISTIVAAIRHNFAEGGRLPEGIQASANMNLVGTGPGSFVVELAATQSADLFGDSAVNIAIEELFGLLRESNDEQQLQQRLINLQYRASNRYRELLKVFVDNAQEIDAEWASPKRPNDPPRQARLSPTTAEAVIKIIDEIPPINETYHYEVVGRLIGANERRAEYEIEALNGLTYKGEIIDINNVLEAGATIGKQYRAEIREDVQMQPNRTKPTSKYALLKIEPID